MKGIEMRPFEEVAPLVKALDDKHGEEITALDLRDCSSVADVFVLVTANSQTHMQTLQDIAEEAMDRMSIPCRVEGKESARWRVVDGGHVVVHIFSKTGRDFYRLERIWGDAPTRTFGQRA